MMLEQIERRQRLQQEKRMQKAQAPKLMVVETEKPTKTLGVHNCPVELVERISAIAKRESKAQGKRISLANVAVWLLVLGLDQLGEANDLR
jgi:hypothetical protein